MLDENERLMIRVMIGNRSSKHITSKLAGIGSRQQDFLALLRMSPRNSVSVVGIKQSRAVLNRGLSSCSVKDNTMSSGEKVGRSVRILVILFTKKSEKLLHSTREDSHDGYCLSVLRYSNRSTVLNKAFWSEAFFEMMEE